MKESKTLNKVLSVFMVVCLFAAFIISVSARMWDSNFYVYHSLSDHLKVNWSAGAPFLVLCLIGLGAGATKLVRYVKLNGKTIKDSSLATIELILLIAFVVAALLSCVSLAMFPKIENIATADLSYKCVAPIVTSVIAFATSGAECILSFAKIDK
ncbi:MAG: hypothetical protein ACOQNY_00790 [Mycoplasmoidaceae bacterium]